MFQYHFAQDFEGVLLVEADDGVSGSYGAKVFGYAVKAIRVRFEYLEEGCIGTPHCGPDDVSHY